MNPWELFLFGVALAAGLLVVIVGASFGLLLALAMLGQVLKRDR